MNLIFSDEPEKRKFIMNELKEYTEQGDMNRLASSLNSVLVTPQQRTLLQEIKPFIPIKQQSLFDHLTSLHNSSTVFNNNNNNNMSPGVAKTTKTPSQDFTAAGLATQTNMRNNSIALSPTIGGAVDFTDRRQMGQPRLSFKIAPLANPPNGKR